MAKNKAKMNKFVTGVATAAMVATAVVPVASAAGFTDLGDNVDAGVKADIDKAVTLGFFKEAAKFNPSAQITRGQAALTLARYIAGGDDQVENYAIEHDLESKVTLFNDIPVSYKTGQGFEKELYYASLVVKNAGAFTQLNLNPAGPVTRSQMAKIVTQTFGLEKAEDYVSTITDIDHLDAATKGFIETIASQNVTIVNKFMPAGAVTRSQMASFLVRANDAANPTPEPGVTDVKVKSVMAITSTGVTVAITAPTEEVVDATVVVKNLAGQVIATKPVTIKAGATTASFQFETPLTVSPTEGWTVNGVKYVVAELAIAQVERLTDNGKYLEVLFNKPLTSLEVSEIAIRNADTIERVGVEAVKLASDGLSAQITLLGSEDAALDEIIASRQDYTLSITKAGKVTSKVFNLDAVVANVTVTRTNAKENQVNGLKLADNVVVDFEDVLGRTATYWVNKDNFITRINVLNETVKLDAIEIELKADGYYYVNTATEDKSYRLSRGATNTITTKVAGGNSVALTSSLADKAKFESAKLVFDKQGNVKSIVAVQAYTGQLLVSKVDGNIIEAHGDELNLKDYTIIKEGKTIAASDIKALDVVYYNSTSKVAEVYNNTITEKISTVFAGEFKVGSKVYSLAGTQTIDEDGKVVALDQDLIEALEAGEKAVTLSFNRAGDLVFVTGEQGEVTTAKIISFLSKKAVSYDFKGAKYLSLTTQSSKGVKETVEFDVSKLKHITVDGNTTKTNVNYDVSGTEVYNDSFQVGGTIGTDAATITSQPKVTASGNADHGALITKVSAIGTVFNKDKVVDVIKDDKGTVVGLNITTGKVLNAPAKLTSKTLSSADGNLQVVASTPVFVTNADKTVTSTTWGELDKDITSIRETNNNVFVYAKYDKDGVKTDDVDYVTIPSTELIGATEFEDVEGVVADVRYNTDGEIAYLKLAVNGEIKEYSLNLDAGVAGKTFGATIGQLVNVSVYDKSGAVKGLAVATGDNTLTTTLNTADVKVAAGEFKVGSTTYTRATTGVQVYEIVGTGVNKTVEARAFSDLANLKADNKVSFSTVATGSLYVDTIVIGQNKDYTAPVISGLTFTNSVVAAGNAVISLKADAGSSIAVSVTDGSATVTTTDIGSGSTQTISVPSLSALAAGTITATVTVTNPAGTTTSAVTTVLDKTAPLVTSTLTGSGSGLSLVALTGTATLTFDELLNSTSKSTVEAALTSGTTGGTVGYSWTDDKTLVITNSHATDAAVLAGSVNITANITDLAGNTTSGAILVTK